MGTRGLVAVCKNGEYKIAQYNQFDSYPSCLGVKILDFLKKIINNNTLTDFTKNLNLLKSVDDDEYRKLWEDLGIKSNNGFVSMEESEKFYNKYPYLERTSIMDLLDAIVKINGEIIIKKDIDFAKDSLFCEWGYVIDLDHRYLEIYKGFNKKKLYPEDRFYFDGYFENEYYPIKFIARYDFDSLPKSNTLIELQEKIEQEEDEEELEKKSDWIPLFKCPKCGRITEEKEKYCPECGRKNIRY